MPPSSPAKTNDMIPSRTAPAPCFYSYFPSSIQFFHPRARAPCSSFIIFSFLLYHPSYARASHHLFYFKESMMLLFTAPSLFYSYAIPPCFHRSNCLYLFPSLMGTHISILPRFYLLFIYFSILLVRVAWN